MGLLALIALKLAGVIHWSWWWVLSPVWISGALLALAIAGVALVLRREAKRHLCTIMQEHLAVVIQQLPPG
jgi:Flp pilus assembly protein TadB